jgi:hypothetical protein
MATWFAQNSSVNIDSVNQWNSAANGSGSWLTWASLGASDILVANNKSSITINVSFTCATITTAATGGTAGGGFLLAAGVTVTANVVSDSGVCINRTATGAESFIVGNVTGGTANGVHNNSASTISITGNVLGGTSGFGIRNETTGVINVTGNVTAAGTYGIANITTGSINITGNVTGGSGAGGGGSGVYNVATAVVTITGNVTGGTGESSYGVRSDSTGTISISGSITAGVGARAHGVYSPASAYVYLLGTLLTANSDGFAAVVASRPLIHSSATLQHTYRVNNAGVAGVARSLYTGGTNLNQPAISNVRSGTVYGAASEYTGTLAVPSPTLVAIGVATDNTVGSYEPGGGASAADIADAVWDEARSGHVTAGTFGEKVNAELDSASVDAIWNEVLTGATHNIASSAGRRLRQLADTVVLVDGVCDAASNAGTDSTGTITLEVGTTTACVGQAIRCENQVRFIASYDAGTRVAQLDRPWCVVPDAGDEYVIFNVRNPLVGLASLALAGSTAAAVNDVLVDTGTTLPAQINVIDDLLDTEMPALTAAVAAEAVKTTAIQAKTDNLPTDPADQSLLEAAITAATSPLATPAQVNAQVLDVLSVDTFAELTAPPAATSSLKDKITWLFMYARNKVTQTASARTLYRDDTTTVAGTSTTSDNGTTFTKGEDS